MNKIKTKKIRGSSQRPRLSVFRSNKGIYAQIINDEEGKTLAAASQKNLSKSSKTKSRPESKTDRAGQVGLLLAKRALKKKVNKVVFDRGRRPYHGRVKALAEGARQGGLKF